MIVSKTIPNIIVPVNKKTMLSGKLYFNITTGANLVVDLNSGRKILFIQRQSKPKSASVVWVAIYPNISVVLPDNFGTDVQA
jgi:hypothetical protein